MSTHPPPSNSDDAADHDLLLRFSGSGDEAAFREIVNRYAGFVRAVAQRTTGDAGLAEDTAQTVFALLARKAREAASTDHLGGWLHRTTVFHALRRLRTETRHRRKIAAFATAMPNATQDHSPAWHDALPLLDASLQRLRESERRVLIMRYFEDHGYPAIAAATGKSAEAVKKQTSRALDRLRGLMQARGVAVTSTALAAGMASQTTAHAAVPASALATSSLKAASGLTWQTLTLNSLHLMNLSKPAAAVILLCAAPLAWQEHAIAKARRELTAVERVSTIKPSEVTPALAVLPTLGGQTEEVVMNIEQFDRDIHSAYSSYMFNPISAAAAAVRRLDALDGPALAALINDVPRLPISPAERADREFRLFVMLTKRAPRLALRTAPGLLQKSDDMRHQYQSAVGDALAALLKEDPDAAIKEYRDLLESDMVDGKGVGSGSGASLHGPFTGKLLGVRFEEGKAVYATLDLNGRINALGRAGFSESAEARSFVLAESAKLEPRHRPFVLRQLLSGEAMRNGLEGAAALFKQLPMEPGQSVDIAARFLSDCIQEQSTPVDEGINWLRAQLPPAQFAEAGGLLIGKFSESPSGHRQEYRNKLFRATDWGPHRDEALAALFKPKSIPDDAGEALSLVVEIHDPAIRMETLRQITSRFKGQPGEWKNAVESATTLTPDEKTRIFQP